MPAPSRKALFRWQIASRLALGLEKKAFAQELRNRAAREAMEGEFLLKARPDFLDTPRSVFKEAQKFFL